MREKVGERNPDFLFLVEVRPKSHSKQTNNTSMNSHPRASAIAAALTKKMLASKTSLLVRFLTVTVCGLVGAMGIAPLQAAGTRANPVKSDKYLYVWAGDELGILSDFLAAV